MTEALCSDVVEDENDAKDKVSRAGGERTSASKRMSGSPASHSPVFAKQQNRMILTIFEKVVGMNQLD
jgi:hypothetical protein